MWCTQCKRDKPASEFYPLKRRGWRVTKCNECAKRNMAKWRRTSLSKFDPNSVREAAD